jgi:3-methyladenine DNA glycosylase/8-oxoguanine DNA glycosylase
MCYDENIQKDEAQKMLFWNYYKNKNAPDRIAWGQGLYRYISDEQAANILRDIAKLKSGSPDEELAQEFFEYFCKINKIEPESLLELSGTLKNKKYFVKNQIV